MVMHSMRKLSSITTETTTKRSLLVYFPVSLKYLFCSPCPSCAIQYVVNCIFCYWKIPCWYRFTERNFRSSRSIRLLEMPESTSCLRGKHFWYLHFLNSQMIRIIVTHTHRICLISASSNWFFLYQLSPWKYSFFMKIVWSNQAMSQIVFGWDFQVTCWKIFCSFCVALVSMTSSHRITARLRL